MNFYPIEIKFSNGSGKPTDAAIKIVSKKVHVEAKFPDGMSFSSTFLKEALDGGNGPRFKNILYSHPARWNTYVLWVTKEELEAIRFDCEVLAACGLRYDTRGAIGCTWSGEEDPWDWFCSEVVFDRIFTRWMPARLNYRMHPDNLEKLAIVLECKLLERKYKVDGI